MTPAAQQNSAATDPAEPLLRVRNLAKTFGHVRALRGVDFSLHAGELLAIVGDNGAGKSTLIKTLSGVYDHDAGGSISMRGTPVRFGKPADAVRAGIATVYQDLALVDTRDVAANLFLGRELKRGPFVDRKRMRREAEAVLQDFTFRLPSVRVPISYLSGGQRQVVAIARVLLHGAEVIIMDEPTAALGVQESARVIDLIGQLRDQGRAVIVISHNLQQIWPVADRFLVMHLGKVAGIRTKATTSVDEIVRLIVYGDQPAPGSSPALATGTAGE
jgi:ABC-type sugar transport system ATPase subunit